MSIFGQRALRALLLGRLPRGHGKADYLCSLKGRKREESDAEAASLRDPDVVDGLGDCQPTQQAGGGSRQQRPKRWWQRRQLRGR